MVSLLEISTKAKRQYKSTKRSEQQFLIGIIKQESSKT
jgi:hypothetical protein